MADDIELYRRWAAGDRRAGGRLVDRHIDSIGRFFTNKVADPSDTEDLVALTFERCSRSLGTFKGDSSFRTYLFGIARNQLREYLRRKSRRPDDVDFHVTRLADIAPSPSVIVGERKEQGLLLTALRSIPIELQMVIELSFFENMTQREIAEVLDVPPGTVASRIRRGKEALFVRMKEIAQSPELLESTMHGLERWVEEISRFDSEEQG
jgi:RNA polymerase sigma-70 factor (ECF subfamily)